MILKVLQKKKQSIQIQGPSKKPSIFSKAVTNKQRYRKNLLLNYKYYAFLYLIK